MFADHPMADFKFELTETYEKWTYCVQYRETDFNFVSRLMEHEGIYYYYRHIDGDHTMVLTDSIAKHESFPGYDAIKFIRPQQLGPARHRAHQQLGVLRAKCSRACTRSTTTISSGRASTCDSSKPLPRNYTPSDYEGLDYPGLFTPESRRRAAGAAFAATSSAASSSTAHGGDQRARRVRRFDLHARRIPARGSEPRAPDPVGQLRPGIQRLRGDARAGRVGLSLHASWRCRPSSSSGRSGITPKPFVQGPQTAVVVGPAGDEIYTDKYGRVKVQFHWDRYGKKDEKSSCWIRVSHPWAGKGWGAIVDAAHRPGGDRRFSRRRSRSADHHRPRVQRRATAAVRAPGGRGGQRRQVGHAQGRRLQRDVDGRHGRHGADVHPRPVQHGHHDRARPDATVHNSRTDRVDVDDSETIGNNQTRTS